ncbi:MAG: DUF2461 domain-containing protein [Polyangiales bacterium]
MARTATPPRDAPTFQGFADAEMSFFHALDACQDRAWFTANRAAFDDGWARPMEALLLEVRGALADAYRGLTLRPPKVFRLHRDVRFSLDKSPYKTHVSGIVTLKGKEGLHEAPAALYLQLGTECFAGAGMYALQGDALRRFRAAVEDPRTGAGLDRIVDTLRGQGFTFGAMESLKTLPRGVPKDHPRAELLQRKGLVAMFPAIPRALVPTRAFFDWALARASESAPLVRWLDRHVASGGDRG